MSGEKVYDWVIPDEWNIKDAYVSKINGEKVIDFKENNLHLVSYSMPVNKIVSKSNFYLIYILEKIYLMPFHT